jgi:hypothetical protein
VPTGPIGSPATRDGDHRAAVEQIAVERPAGRHHRRRVDERAEIAADAAPDAKVGRERACERRASGRRRSASPTWRVSENGTGTTPAST